MLFSFFKALSDVLLASFELVCGSILVTLLVAIHSMCNIFFMTGMILLACLLVRLLYLQKVLSNIYFARKFAALHQCV